MYAAHYIGYDVCQGAAAACSFVSAAATVVSSRGPRPQNCVGKMNGEFVDLSTGIAMFVALLSAIGWVTSEVARRSDPHRLEQLAAVVSHVSTGSPQNAEFQKEIDRLALRVAIRRRRPNYSLLWFLALGSGIFTTYVVVCILLNSVLSSLNPAHLAPDLTWLFWGGYVITLVSAAIRVTNRSIWLDEEYRRIACEPRIAFSWRKLFTA